MLDEYIILDTYQAETELEEFETLMDIIDEEIARERIQKILTEIETAKTKLEELKRECEETLMKIKRPKETIEEVREEFADMEEKAERSLVGRVGKEREVKLIPEKEAMTVALSRLPSATTRMREKAREIIEKYNLTEEDVNRLYWYFFGE